MQELAIILSSIAGACTAVAAKKFPKNKKSLISLGPSSQIQNQISSLRMEKDILIKTITRLNQQADPEISKITRDRLLLRYQHQLGIILAKIEKLEQASKHPDLGPVGEGLITLMDQKLSKLDQRLYDLSAKINLATIQLQETKESPKSKEKKLKPPQVNEIKKQEIIVPQPKPEEQEKIIPPKHFKPVEITTLTELPNIEPQEFPLIENRKIVEPQEQLKEEILKPQEKIPEKVETVTIAASSQTITEPHFTPVNKDVPLLPKQEIVPKLEEIGPKPQEKSPTPKVNLPTEDEFDEDDMDDELDKIKRELMKTLSKLDQVEVE